MPHKDACRWDARYREQDTDAPPRPKRFLIEHADLLPNHGLALDLAMGLGANAGFLLDRGLRVVGVDISGVAVRRAKALWPALMAVVADLAQFHLPADTFDVISNFYYLQRDLWSPISRALRPGGVLLFETFLLDPGEPSRVENPAYLLAPGELKAGFQELETVFYQERRSTGKGGKDHAIAGLVARKTVS